MATQYIIILMLLMSVFLFTKSQEIRERHQISVRQFMSFVLFLNLVGTTRCVSERNFAISFARYLVACARPLSVYQISGSFFGKKSP
jgi:hypothetical protein